MGKAKRVTRGLSGAGNKAARSLAAKKAWETRKKKYPPNGVPGSKGPKKPSAMSRSKQARVQAIKDRAAKRGGNLTKPGGTPRAKGAESQESASRRAAAANRKIEMTVAAERQKKRGGKSREELIRSEINSLRGLPDGALRPLPKETRTGEYGVTARYATEDDYKAHVLPRLGKNAPPTLEAWRRSNGNDNNAVVQFNKDGKLLSFGRSFEELGMGKSDLDPPKNERSRHKRLKGNKRTATRKKITSDNDARKAQRRMSKGH